MFYQKVENGELVDYPVLAEQVPQDQADLYHLVDMEQPIYDPYEQTLIDHGVVLGDGGVPYRKWEITDVPELERVNPWFYVAGRAKLLMLKTEDQSGIAEWDAYRLELQNIIDNAELENPVGDSENISWPTPPEPIQECTDC